MNHTQHSVNSALSEHAHIVSVITRPSVSMLTSVSVNSALTEHAHISVSDDAKNIFVDPINHIAGGAEFQEQ